MKPYYLFNRKYSSGYRNSFMCRLVLLLSILCLSLALWAQETPQNVTASCGNKQGVTVSWNAVPGAVGYEVTAESWDVAINKAKRTVNVAGNNFVDKDLPQPGLGRYTVKAVFADGTKSEPSAAATGYAMLDTMRLLGVSARWPWNGTVDIDVEYKTVRHRFRELFGMEDLPYPKCVAIYVKKADGTFIPVKSVTKEPAVDSNIYTVNRKIVENGTEIFSGSGWLRLVWDADADAPNVTAHGATVILAASDDYFKTEDSLTVDIDTTNPDFIELGENDITVPLPWVSRWADEASRSLNMQDGSDVEITEISDNGKTTKSLFKQTQLGDEEGTFSWQPSAYGVIDLKATFYNRATGAKSTLSRRFLRVPDTPVRVERVEGQNAIDLFWASAENCHSYQVVRCTVARDGTRSDWQNMASVSTDPDGWYRDISVTAGTTYEYAACPRYPVPEDLGEYLTSTPTQWAKGRIPVGIKVDAKAADKNSIALSWTDVPDAYSYFIYRDGDGEQLKLIGKVAASTGTSFTDQGVKPGIRYTYCVKALNLQGSPLETSAPANAYTQLDVFAMNRLQPRFPWNGLVDVIISYSSARDAQTDGTPHFRLTATSGNAALDMKTLTQTDGMPLDPNNFTVPADGMEQRLLWDARKDLGEENFPDGLTVSVSCIGVEPVQADASTTPFAEEAVSAATEHFDLRSVPEIRLGTAMTINADIAWFHGARHLDVSVNGRNVFSTDGPIQTSFTIGKEQLDEVGINTLRLKVDDGTEWAAVMKYPDFSFTATQGKRDAILLEWTDIQGIREYSVRRSLSANGGTPVEVARISGMASWEDASDETVVGEFRYTVMPVINGEDAMPQLAAVTGYRAFDILRPVLLMPVDHGRVAADRAEARYGDTVMLSVMPDTGFVLSELRITAGGETVDAVPAAEGGYTFVMPADNVVVTAAFTGISGIGNVSVARSAQGKVLRDGQILIIRNGKTYTPAGVKVK